jgi:two-component system response regulator YesN
MLDLHFDQACGILISINEVISQSSITDSARRKVYNKRVYVKVLKLFETLGVKFVAAELNNCLYILLLMDGIESDYNRKLYSLHLIGKVKAYLKKEMEVSLYSGIGNTFNSMEKLYNSFFEAKIAHDHDSDTAQGLHFSDINIKIQYIKYPFDEEKKLCDKVSNGHSEEAGIYLEKLVTWVVTNCSSLKEMHEKLFEILIMITRSAAVFEHIDAKLLNTSIYWEEIRGLQSAMEIYNYMQRIVKEISNGINRVRNLNMNEQISQAAEFIKLNYQRNISLDDVAKAVSLSPYYLSKLFKTVTGENFIDYLTKYRLSLAENLLRDGAFNVSEICFKVGYNDPNYFSKLFKKYYHLNPSDYKHSQNNQSGPKTAQ